jgi:hypothetical protein
MKSLNVAIVNLWNDFRGGTRVALTIADILLKEGHKVELHSLGGPSIEMLDKVHGTSLMLYIGSSLKVKYYLGGVKGHILSKATLQALELYRIIFRYMA